MNFIIHSLNKHVTNAFGHKTPFNVIILLGWRSKANHFPRGGAKSPSRDNKEATVCLLLEPPRCREEVHKGPNFIIKTLKQTFSQKIYFIKKVEEF